MINGVGLIRSGPHACTVQANSIVMVYVALDQTASIVDLQGGRPVSLDRKAMARLEALLRRVKSQAECAKLFGVSARTIGRIAMRIRTPHETSLIPGVPRVFMSGRLGKARGCAT